MGKNLSEDLKWRIIYCYQEGFRTKEIAKRLYISKTTVIKVCKIFDKWGCVSDPFVGKPGKRKIFMPEDMQILREIVQEKVDYYLDELVHEMEVKTGKLVSIPTLWRSLQYCGITRKKLQKAAYERNETLRGYFMYQIGIEYSAEQLIFIDETSKDERSISRLYGYSNVNNRANKKVVFIRGKRYTILPALTIDGFIAAEIMEGSCDKDKFRTFIITQVLSQMNPYPGKNSVLIMDNARIHHDTELIESIEEVGCKILYLPPYSPDLNPIETAFSTLKCWLKRYRDIVNSCDDPIYMLLVALSQIIPNMAKQYFQQSIYM